MFHTWAQDENSLLRLADNNPDEFLSTVYLFLQDKSELSYTPTNEELLRYVQINREVGDFHEAEFWGDSLAKRTITKSVSTSFEAQIIRLLAGIKKVQAKHDDALLLYDQLLAFHKLNGNKKKIAEHYVDMAEFHRSIFNFEIGLGYIEMARAVFQDTIFPRKLYARLLGRQAALITESSGPRERVIELSIEAIRIGEEIADDEIVATSCNELGYILGNEQSQKYYERSIEIWKVMGRGMEENHTKLNLASAFSRQGKLAEGIDLAEDVLKNAEENNWVTLSWIAHEFLGNANAKNGNWNKAAFHVNQALETAISIHESRHSRQLKVVQSKNEADIAQAELEIQKQEFDRVKVELRNKQLERNWLLTVIIAIALTLVLVFYLYTKITKINKTLSRQKSNFEALNIEMKQTIEQREMLIQEVHHRVKNNLQIISSILNMQASAEQEKSTVSSIKKAQQRVRSIAMIHEKLYQADTFSSIDFREYLFDLTQQIKSAVSSEDFIVEIEVVSIQVSLNIDYAIPLGLIINEIVTNSIKYAFPERKSGNIAINFKSTGANQYELRVSDDGIGMKLDDSANVKPSTLGRSLIELLSRQLKAVYEVDSTNGTEYTIRFVMDA
jgi:two-component sensor histidine kinase